MLGSGRGASRAAGSTGVEPASYRDPPSHFVEPEQTPPGRATSFGKHDDDHFHMSIRGQSSKLGARAESTSD